MPHSTPSVSGRRSIDYYGRQDGSTDGPFSPAGLKVGIWILLSHVNLIQSSSPPMIFTSHSIQVLVVDDDPMCLKVVSAMLQRCNYEGTPLFASALSQFCWYIVTTDDDDPWYQPKSAYFPWLQSQQNQMGRKHWPFLESAMKKATSNLISYSQTYTCQIWTDSASWKLLASNWNCRW